MDSIDFIPWQEVGRISSFNLPQKRDVEIVGKNQMFQSAGEAVLKREIFLFLSPFNWRRSPYYQRKSPPFF